MKIFHVYEPAHFEGLVKNDLINEDSGFKIQHVFSMATSEKFNVLAAKGGKFHQFIKENGYPFYIDRLTGGLKYHPYDFDKALLAEYRSLLGEWFLGIQLHELCGNRANDWNRIEKLMEGLPYTVENLKEQLFSPESTNPQNMPIYKLTQGTPEEYANLSRPRSIEEVRRDLAGVISKRMEQTDGMILSCDSGTLLFHLENKMGVRAFLPEVGYQTAHTRIQIALARGMAKAYGKKWGVYYECWKKAENGTNYTQPVYGNLPYNDWNYTQDQFGDDFTTCGENGGSSRLLQRRIYFHALMSGAEFMAEEWGFVRTFADMNTYTLSPYGKVKKEFIDFARNHKNMKPMTPFAIVLPCDLDCLHVGSGFRGPLGTPATKFMRATTSPAEAIRFGKIHDVLKIVFQRPDDAKTYGNEGKTLQNSRFGDLFDIVYADAPKEALKQYDLLIDADPEGAFAKANPSLAVINGQNFDEMTRILKERAESLLPATVDNLHWILSEDEHGRYLTIFNNEGNNRTIAEGDTIDRAADATVTVTLHDAAELSLLYASASVEIKKIKDGVYTVTVPATQLAVFKL